MLIISFFLCFRDLDAALIRRFEKRILLDIPSERSRLDLFKYFFSKTGYDFSGADYEKMGQATRYFSGSDIRMVCKEVVMNIVRKQLAHLNKSGRFYCFYYKRKKLILKKKKTFSINKFYIMCAKNILDKFIFRYIQQTRQDFI